MIFRGSGLGMLVPVAVPFLAILVLSPFSISPERSGESASVTPGLAELRQFDPPRDGLVFMPGEGNGLSNEKIRTVLGSGGSVREQAWLKQLSRADGELFTLTAMGLDYRHHPVNAYLTEYQPFAAEKIWEPWVTIARRLRYRLDEHNFSGLMEVWQTSGQAWTHMRGDCEDHAILLADWLISMGEDARVVIGEYDGGGHAWVLLIRDGQEYILEATSKRSRKRFPLASSLPEYRPTHMFNRDVLWQNTGSRYTTRYSTANWRQVSAFQAI